MPLLVFFFISYGVLIYFIFFTKKEVEEGEHNDFSGCHDKYLVGILKFIEVIQFISSTPRGLF